MVELRNQIAQLSHLFLKFAAVRHTPPWVCNSGCEAGPISIPASLLFVLRTLRARLCLKVQD